MRIFQNIFRGALIFTALLISIALIISFYPFKEYTFAQQPYPVISKQVKVGGTLYLKADYCKLSNAKGDIIIIFEGDVQYISPTKISFQAPKGCIKTDLAIPLPKDLPPGLHRYHGHGEYTKFIFGKAKVDAYSEYFEIIN